MAGVPFHARPVPDGDLAAVRHLHDTCRLAECVARSRAILDRAADLPDRRPRPGEAPLELVTETLLQALAFAGAPLPGSATMAEAVARGWLPADGFYTRFQETVLRANRGVGGAGFRQQVKELTVTAGRDRHRLAMVDVLKGAFFRYFQEDDYFRHHTALIQRFLVEGNLPRYMTTISRTALFHCYRGRYTEAENLARQALGIARRHRLLPRIVGALITLMIAANKTGRPRRALALAEELFDENGCWDTTAYCTAAPTDYTAVQLLRGRAWLELGDLDRAGRFIREALAFARRHRLHRDAALCLESLADLALARGELDTARRRIDEATTIHAGLQPVSGDVAGMLRREGSLLLAEGKEAAAVDVLQRALEMAQRTGEAFETALALRELGRACRRLDRPAEATNHLRRALRRFEMMGARLEQARCQLELARTTLAWDRRLRAGDPAAPEWPDSPLSPLGTAWAAAADAYRLFDELDRPADVAACEALIHELRQPGDNATAALPAPRPGERPFVAVSPAMRRVVEWIDLAARSESPALLIGESGTGKEMAARRIHALSERAHGPFVAVNCGAIPTTLFEREFFGHAAGAYTGAGEGAAGYLEQAEGGTLLLDEIVDLAPALQVKLLRVLQDGTFRRLGDPTVRRADVRFLAAAASPLEPLVRSGRFRADLFYRIHTLEIRLPPLRERPEDLLPLVRYFIGETLGDDVSTDMLFTPGVMTALRAHSWPGNVRELESLMRRLALLYRRHGRVSAEMLPPEMQPEDHGPVTANGNFPTLEERLRATEREAFREALHRAGGNRLVAARFLGLGRSAFYRRLRRLGLVEEDDGDRQEIARG